MGKLILVSYVDAGGGCYAIEEVERAPDDTLMAHEVHVRPSAPFGQLERSINRYRRRWQEIMEPF